MNHIIQVKRTFVVDREPTTLADGELAAAIANNPVRMWIGAGSGAVKELFAGEAVEDAEDDTVYGRCNGEWVPQPAVSATAPADPAPNTLWIDSTDMRLFLYFNEQWVEVKHG